MRLPEVKNSNWQKRNDKIGNLFGILVGLVMEAYASTSCCQPRYPVYGRELDTDETSRSDNSEEAQPTEVSVSDIEALSPLFDELYNLLKSGHSKSEEILGEIRTRLANNAATHMDRIQEQIEDYEFEEAMETLSEAASLLGISIKIGAGK